MPSILILDYSTSRIAIPTIRPWLPDSDQVTSLVIDSEASFPVDLVDRGFTHVIHSGSELSITECSPFTLKAESFIRQATKMGIAQMGICYGHQLICRALVGESAVRASPNGFEAGWGEIAFNQRGIEVLGLHPIEKMWQHHFDEVIALPPGSEVIACSHHSEIQATINPGLRLLGTQFHPEVTSAVGNRIFKKDQALLREYGYDVDKITSEGPSKDAGRLLFDYFLNRV